MNGIIERTGETVDCEAHLELDPGTELTRPVTRRSANAVRRQVSRCWAAPTLRATAQVAIHNPMVDVIANLRRVP